MIKITIKVEGMMCSHCEAHTNEAIKRVMKVKSVESSSDKGETIVVADKFDEDTVKKAIEDAGYKVNGISVEQLQENKRFLKRLFNK